MLHTQTNPRYYSEFGYYQMLSHSQTWWPGFGTRVSRYFSDLLIFETKPKATNKLVKCDIHWFHDFWFLEGVPALLKFFNPVRFWPPPPPTRLGKRLFLACFGGMIRSRINPQNRGQEQCAWSTLERIYHRVARTVRVEKISGGIHFLIPGTKNLVRTVHGRVKFL